MFNNGIETTVKGNLTEIPELKSLPDGTAVTNFSIASNRRWIDSRTNQPRTETAYVRLSLFGVQAQNAVAYLVKGQAVTVRGRMIVDAATGGPAIYQRKDGFAGAKFEVRVDEIDYGEKPQAYYAAVAQAGYANRNTPLVASPTNGQVAYQPMANGATVANGHTPQHNGMMVSPPNRAAVKPSDIPL